MPFAPCWGGGPPGSRGVAAAATAGGFFSGALWGLCRVFVQASQHAAMHGGWMLSVANTLICGGQGGRGGPARGSRVDVLPLFTLLFLSGATAILMGRRAVASLAMDDGPAMFAGCACVLNSAWRSGSHCAGRRLSAGWRALTHNIIITATTRLHVQALYRPQDLFVGSTYTAQVAAPAIVLVAWCIVAGAQQVLLGFPPQSSSMLL